MNGTFKQITVCAVVANLAPTSFCFVLVVVEGEWVGCWWWCESREVTARPKETQLQPETQLSSPPAPLPPNKNNKNLPPPPPHGQLIPYRGWPHQPPHMHAHTQSHTAASLSVQEKCFSFPFFCLFSLFWDFLLFFLVGKEEELFFFF